MSGPRGRRLRWLGRRRGAAGGSVHGVYTATRVVAKRDRAAGKNVKRPGAVSIERVPGVAGDGALRPASGRQLRRLALPPHRATSDVLQSVYPWMADAGIGQAGQFIGHNVLGGRAFSHDPWQWYEAGVVTNPNMMVFGEIGSRKSTLVKTMIARGFEFGRDAFITDVKSEYSDLATFLDTEPLFLGPGLDARLNPFDPGPGWQDDPEAVAERQLAMLVALGTAVLDRSLSQSELTLCKIAIAAVTDGDLHVQAGADGGAVPVLAPPQRLRVPILPEVVDAMMTPSPDHLDRLPLDWTALREATADLIMGFQRLIDGDLRAMFDERTNIDTDPGGRLIVVNLSRVLEQRRQALPLVRICATSWLQSALSRRDGRRRFVVADEAWADLTLGTLRWYQSSFKLTRRDLVANLLVFHKPADVLAAGDAGSERERLAESLIADTGTTVFYRQRAQQIPLLRAYYGINSAEQDAVRVLPPGQALWKVSENRSAVVQHVRSDLEATFTNTDPAATDTARTGTDRIDTVPLRPLTGGGPR